MAQQLGVTLWPGQVPPGSRGHATMGDNWQVQTLHYLPGNVFFQSPDIEMLRIFDLLDRGFDPGRRRGVDEHATAIRRRRCGTRRRKRPSSACKYVYLASRNKVYVNGTWEVVLRVE